MTRLRVDCSRKNTTDVNQTIRRFERWLVAVIDRYVKFAVEDLLPTAQVCTAQFLPQLNLINVNNDLSIYRRPKKTCIIDFKARSPKHFMIGFLLVITRTNLTATDVYVRGMRSLTKTANQFISLLLQLFLVGLFLTYNCAATHLIKLK